MPGRVMVVDDSEADRLFAQIMLERWAPGASVVGFESARAALVHLHAPGHGVNLVLLDINMPGMDGWGFLAACEAAPALAEGPRVVMLTSSPDPADQQRAQAHDRVLGFITKPLSRDALQALNGWLALAAD
ncbi:MAG: response regulator [Rubrivivax sp.]|jgi:CheY-like chemotaxis protein